MGNIDSVSTPEVCLKGGVAKSDFEHALGYVVCILALQPINERENGSGVWLRGKC